MDESRGAAHSKQKPPLDSFCTTTCFAWTASSLRWQTRVPQQQPPLVGLGWGLISHRQCVTMLKLIKQENVSIICRRLIALRSTTLEAYFTRSSAGNKNREKKNLKPPYSGDPTWVGSHIVIIIKQSAWLLAKTMISCRGYRQKIFHNSLALLT